ncbi:MAG: hypothetical protein Q4E05_03115, partial [Pseudoclavibacter sp.]|nr:hypothetical protein [Pseudoclavibacter sp.]
MSASVRGERATSIRDLVDIAAISHFVAQMELAEHIGGAEPRFELSLPVVRFAAAEGVLEFPLRVLGSRSRDDLRWEWAWHTPGRYAPGLLGVVEQIRLKGLREAIPEITEPVVPVSAADALHLVIASKALSGVLTSYETEAAPGLTVHLLLGNANPRTPGPDRIAEAIAEAVEAGCLHDHRTAIAAFAKRFQIPSRWSRERAILLAPGGSLDIELDEQGRVDRIRLQGRDGPRALEGGGAQAAPAAAHPAGSVPQPAPERPLALGGPPPVREAAGLLSPYPQPSGPPPPLGPPS